MKLLLLLMLPFASFAQTEGNWLTLDSIKCNLPHNEIIYTDTDTVRVIMLVSDTTCKAMPITSSSISAYIDGPVTWIIGFEVRQLMKGPSYQPVVDPRIIFDQYWSFTTSFYLDINKQPLKKSTVVWLSKEL